MQKRIGTLQFVTSTSLTALAQLGRSKDLRTQVEAYGSRHFAVLDQHLKLLSPPTIGVTPAGEFERCYRRADSSMHFSLLPIEQVREVLVGYDEMVSDEGVHFLDPNLAIGSNREDQYRLIPNDLVGRRISLSRFDSRTFMCEAIIRLPGEIRLIVAESPTPLIVFATDGQCPASCGAIIEPRRPVQEPQSSRQAIA